MMPAALARDLEGIVGAGHVLDADALAGRDPGYWRGNLAAGLLVRPGDTGALSRCLAFLDAHGLRAAIHGGLTGLVGGGDSREVDVILSSERLTRLAPPDPFRRTLSAGAGIVLAVAQNVAERAGLRIGLDLGARGRCTLGGVVATNAGGSRVLRYGMVGRDVAGLEAVLADGTVLPDRGGLDKDNAGFDPARLLIGSEGTLGVVAGVTLRLHPRPAERATALVAFARFADLLAAARHLRAALGDEASALEAMWGPYVEATRARAGVPSPFAEAWPLWLLVESEGAAGAAGRLEAALGGVPAFGDAVVAQNARQAALFWRLREDADAVEHLHAAVHSFDVGVRPDDLAAYVAAAEAALAAALPAARLYSFGHVADGNIHFMVGLSRPSCARRWLTSPRRSTSRWSACRSISERATGWARAMAQPVSGRPHGSFARSTRRPASIPIGRAISPMSAMRLPIPSASSAAST
jgi:FAD/FMN-containing dehydrogenase